MNQQEIQAIVEKQRAFFHTGATLDVEKRIQALKKLQSCILRYEDEIGAALKQDLGKSSFESYMCESGLVLSELSYMLRHVRSYSREKRVRTPLAQFHSRSFKKPSPYGVTLIMSPWNYPFLLTIDPLVDAIAAGNTAVVKPSAYSPATSELMARILRSMNISTIFSSPAARQWAGRSCGALPPASLPSPWSWAERAPALWRRPPT